MNSQLLKLALIVGSVAVVGCSDIVIKVNKKSKSGIESSPASSQEEVSGIALTANSVYDFLQEQDNLKSVAAQALIDQIENHDFRSKLRQSTRQFRDSIVRNAQTEHSYASPLFDALESLECSDFHNDGAKSLLSQKHLGTLLKGALLSKLSQDAAVSLDINQLNEETLQAIHLLLFDMGITFKDVTGTTDLNEGGPQVSTSADGVKTIKHGFMMRIANEEGEDEFASADENDISIYYERALKDGKNLSFSLSAEVGKSLLESNPSGDISFLKMSIVSKTAESGIPQVIWLAQNGTRNDGKESLVYSRMITFSQNPEKRNTYTLEDIQRYDMEGSRTNSLTVDFDALSNCATPNDETASTTDKPNDQGNSQTGADESESESDGSDPAGNDNSESETGDTDKGGSGSSDSNPDGSDKGNADGKGEDDDLDDSKDPGGADKNTEDDPSQNSNPSQSTDNVSQSK